MPEQAREVWDQFLLALSGLALDADLAQTVGDGWDARGTIAGVDVVVDVRANPTVGDVLALAARGNNGAHKILVAGQIWGPAREALRGQGISYFDGRGHLRLWEPPLLVDTPVPTRRNGPSNVRPRGDSPSAIDVALAVLDGTTAGGVRAAAEVLGRAPSTVSKRLAALRAAYLVDEEGRPVVPALFEAVLAAWHPVRLPLADLPRPGAGPVNARLGVGLDDPDGPGWVLADMHAAAAWGAPVVLPGDAPPDFYVANAASAARARALLGDAHYGRHACTVAVAPAPYVCRRRFNRTAVADEPFRAPSLVVAALDLAADPARGRETLDLWSRDLPPEVSRVW